MQTLNPAKEYCIRGASRHAQGDLPGALADFGNALEADPRCVEAWNNHGAARHALGDLAGAMADFSRALDIDPRSAEACNNRGIVHHALGNYDAALADFDRALELRPRYAEALSNRATTRQAQGDLSEAVADLDRAIGIKPDRAEAYHDRAGVLHALGDLDGARADYDRVLQLIPREQAAPVYHLRGSVFSAQSRFAEALADCNEALEIDPDFCLAYLSRGNMRYHLRDMAAPADYATAFRLNAQAAANEVLRFVTMGIREDAAAVLENCRKHIRICPDDAIAYTRRGLTLLLLSREAEARDDLEQAARRLPKWRDYLTLLIEVAKQQRCDPSTAH
jgi:tetratricopeptide (TPR) repeat protein